MHMIFKSGPSTRPTAHSKKLKDSCRTRWVQHIDSYVVFLELLPAFHTCLLAMVSPANFEMIGTGMARQG